MSITRGICFLDIVINQPCGFVPEGARMLPTFGGFHANLLHSVTGETEALALGNWLGQVHNIEGPCLIVSPISWKATHNDAFIEAQGESLQLSDTDALQCFQLIAHFLKESGIELHFHDKYHWIMTAKELPEMYARPVFCMPQVSMMPEMRNAQTSLYWLQLLTELQMLMSTHAFNQTRENKPIINGVWIWGQGPFVKTNVALASDSHHFLLAKTLSSQVSLFTQASSLKKVKTLILDFITPEQIKKITPITSRWFWTDASFSTAPSNVLTAFWRKWFHAH